MLICVKFSRYQYQLLYFDIGVHGLWYRFFIGSILYRSIGKNDEVRAKIACGPYRRLIFRRTIARDTSFLFLCNVVTRLVATHTSYVTIVVYLFFIRFVFFAHTSCVRLIFTGYTSCVRCIFFFCKMCY